MALNTNSRHYKHALIAIVLLQAYTASFVVAASSGLCPPSWNVDSGDNTCANVRAQCINSCDCIYEELYIYQGQETYCCRSVITNICRPSSYSCESGWTEGDSACYTLATQDCKAASQGVFQSILNPRDCCVCRNSDAWLESEAPVEGEQAMSESAGCEGCLQEWDWTPSANARDYLYLITSIQAAETVGAPGEVFNFFKILGGSSDLKNIDAQAAMDEIGNSFEPLAACLQESCTDGTIWFSSDGGNSSSIGGNSSSTGGRRRLHHYHRHLLATLDASGSDASSSAGTATASGGLPVSSEMAPYVQEALDEINRGEITVENQGIRAAMELNEALANGDVTEAELAPFLEASSAPLLSGIAEGYNIGLQKLLDVAAVGLKLPRISSLFTGFIADDSTGDLMDVMVLASVNGDLEDCLNTYDPLKMCKDEPEASESRAKCVAYVKKMQRICANKHYLQAAVLQEALQTNKAYLDTLWAGVSLARAYKKNVEWTRAVNRGAYPNTINRLFTEMKNGYKDGAVAMGKATKDFVDEATSANLDHLQDLLQNGPASNSANSAAGTLPYQNTNGAATDASGSAGSVATDASGSSGSVGAVSNTDASGSSTDASASSGNTATDPGKDCTGAGSSPDDVCWDPVGTDTSVQSVCDRDIAYTFMNQYRSKYRNMDAHTCNKAACADCAATSEGGTGDSCLTVAHNICALCCG